MNTYKIIQAAAAILLNARGEVLITERPAGKIWPGYWEFPGGKIEAGETPEMALKREMLEEIGVTLESFVPFGFVSETREAEGYHVIVLCYLCRAWQGELEAREKQQMAWVRPEALDGYKLLPSNKGLVQQLKEAL